MGPQGVVQSSNLSRGFKFYIAAGVNGEFVAAG